MWINSHRQPGPTLSHSAKGLENVGDDWCFERTSSVSFTFGWTLGLLLGRSCHGVRDSQGQSQNTNAQRSEATAVAHEEVLDGRETRRALPERSHWSASHPPAPKATPPVNSWNATCADNTVAVKVVALAHVVVLDQQLGSWTRLAGRRTHRRIAWNTIESATHRGQRWKFSGGVAYPSCSHTHACAMFAGSAEAKSRAR